MGGLKPGDAFPDGVVFNYVPYSGDKDSIQACGRPIAYDASKEWKDKKVVLFATPGAFTPGCQEKHLPGYIANLQKLKGNGVDVVAVIAMNDPFVMSAWSKANGVKNDDILFMCDTDLNFSKSIDWSQNGRVNRFAMIVDHGTVKYAEKEDGFSTVTVSGAEAVLAKL